MIKKKMIDKSKELDQMIKKNMLSEYDSNTLLTEDQKEKLIYL